MAVSDRLHAALMRIVTPRRIGLLRMVKSREGWGPDRIRVYQGERLRAVIRHCWDHVPFYRRHWHGHLSDPREVQSIDDLVHLPPVTREMFQAHAAEFVTRDASVTSSEARTGGSTASPVIFRTTHYDDELGWAQIYNGWTWAGWRVGEPFLAVGGESVGVGLTDRRTWRDWALHRWVSSGSNISVDRVRELARSRAFATVTLIYGYPNSIREICEHLRHLGACPPRLRGVVCTAEVMLPEVRDRISESLNGVPVFDQWGLNDGAQHACEGPDRDGLHLSFHRGILEVVDDEHKPVTAVHHAGSALATSLTNLATPFVRYDTGDRVHWHAWAPAPSGIAWPRIGQVEGRIGDVIHLRTGRSIPMPGLTLVMRWMPGLKRYQFIQTGPDAVTVRLECGPGFALSEEEVAQFLRHRIADEVQWTVQWGPPELTRARKLLVIRNDWLRGQGLSRPPGRGVSTAVQDRPQ